ncbi:MAG: aminopeptidase [Gemmatimonadetes bacterium]|nr:aminopeptidase [Gemmatimonadota bacterium]
MARWRRWLLLGGGGLLSVLVGAAATTRTGRYIARAAWEEGGILARRRPIAEVIADPRTDARTRGMLGLVQAVRRYAVDSIGLSAGRAYTTYSTLPGDTLVLVLTGARRDRLIRVTWWYPIIGSVPYQGFFRPADAEAARAELEGLGLDAELRPASAFSTLGWLDDPLLSPTLAGDSASVAETVIHELLHTTYFVPGAVSMNESFANMVGHRGAQRFFRSRGDSANARLVGDRWNDEIRLGAFWSWYAMRLDSAFRAHDRDSLARLAARDTLETQARTVLRDSMGTWLRSPRPAGWADRAPLGNNAVLSKTLYRTGLITLDAAVQANRGDLRKAIRQIIEVDTRARKGP